MFCFQPIIFKNLLNFNIFALNMGKYHNDIISKMINRIYYFKNGIKTGCGLLSIDYQLITPPSRVCRYIRTNLIYTV